MLSDRIDPDLLCACVLFAVVFVSHSLSPNATSADSRWTVPQMMSLLAEGNIDLNEYPERLRENRYYAIDCVGSDYRVSVPDPVRGCPASSRYYGHFPIGAPVVALPAMVVMDLVLRVAGPLLLRFGGGRLSPVERAFLSRDYLHAAALVEMVLASFLIAVTTALMFLIAREFLSRRPALLLALLFAYGTAAWSTGSRALWQHGPEMLVLAVAVCLLLKARRLPSLSAWSGVPLALAYFIRPTGAIALVALGLYMLLHHRDRFGKWTLLVMATAAPFLVHHLAVYRRPLAPYFTHQDFLAFSLRSVGPFLAALAGQAISPSRGVLVFSPFLLFLLPGLWLAFREGWQAPLSRYLAAILLVHWIAISAFVDWTAGSCFGPRYFSDVTPLFVFFLIPAFQAFENRHAPRMAVLVFTLTAAIACAIHFRGAANWDVERWNDDGVNSARAWDWHDPQFLRGLH